MNSKFQTLEDRYLHRRVENLFKVNKARELEGYFINNSDLFIHSPESNLCHPKDIAERYAPETILLINHFMGWHDGYERLFYNKEIYKEAIKRGRQTRIVFAPYKNAHLQDYFDIKDIYLNENIPKEHLIQFKTPIDNSKVYPLFEDNSAWKKYEKELKDCFKQGKISYRILMDFGLAMENREGNFQK